MCCVCMQSMVELQQRIAANNSQPMKDATFSEMVGPAPASTHARIDRI
jgi:hypothetical protein